VTTARSHRRSARVLSLSKRVQKRLRARSQRVLVRRHPVFNRVGSTALVPRDKSQRLREAVKDLFRKKRTGETLENPS
jgi:hypothetical protein